MSDLRPCPFCGCEDISLWGGFGTQADISCQSCACERSVQVVDMREEGEDYPTFNEKTFRYPEWLIERTNAHLIDEWNRRSADAEIERLRLWKKAGQDAVKQRDSLVDEVQRLNAELSAYVSENTNLRNDLVQCGMARDNLHKQLEKAREALNHLVRAEALAGVRSIVAGWNGEEREDGPYPPHPKKLGATLPKTTCGAVYELDAAMQRARSLLTDETGK